MVSVQERLKLKRAQIDTWSVREQLCLASSVLRSGDQNWMSVSRSLKAFGDAGRPADWFSQKSCAVQYSNLLENVETPKRKKRTDKGDTSVETPSESIVRRLTQERIEELKKLLFEDKQNYLKLKDEVVQVRSGSADERLTEMCQEIEDEKRQKERRAEAHERWLKEREEKKVELERAWKPPVAPASPHRRKHHPKIHRRNSSQSEPSSEAESALDSPLSEPLNVDVIGEENIHEASLEPKPSQTPTSPLLTSLLKSPSPAPTSQGTSILHSAITSHRGASPTISSLLSSAPGVPGTGSMGTVAPPTTVSSSLKNLVSSAINSEQQHHQPPPHNPSPAAGAPTLSMLLELPPSLPGKPLPELPSAAKTTTVPPSTVSAVLSAAVTPTSTTTTKLIAVRPPVSVTSSSTSKVMPVVSSESSEVPSHSQEVKVADSTSRDDDVEVLQVDSTQNSVDTQQIPIETKEELIEEVLIEEVVVNDDSVIESELLSSQISDVVVEHEEEKVKENKRDEELKLDEEFIEVSQSSEVLSQKEEVGTEMVADVDSTSNNSALGGNAENTNEAEDKNVKEESIEEIIDTSSQEMVSEVVSEEASTMEVVPTSETELTSGAVAEVIEITDDQETTIQTEVVGECGPCMQELEDMEVIILDKVQGLDEVQIVEDMKELECEVVEVVMGAQEKVDDEIKEDTEEVANDSVKPEEVNAEETSSSMPESIPESKRVECDSKTDQIVKESEINVNDTICEKEPLPKEEVSSGNENSTDVPNEVKAVTDVESDDDKSEVKVEDDAGEALSIDNTKEQERTEDKEEKEEVAEDVHADTVSGSELPVCSEVTEDLCITEIAKAEEHIQLNETVKEDSKPESTEKDDSPVQENSDNEPLREDPSEKDDRETEREIEDKKQETSKVCEKEELSKENLKKDITGKELATKKEVATKKDAVKEPVIIKKDVIQESATDDIKETSVKEDQQLREVARQEIVVKNDTEAIDDNDNHHHHRRRRNHQDTHIKEKKESQPCDGPDTQSAEILNDAHTKDGVKSLSKELSKEPAKVNEGTKKVVKETQKKDVIEKTNVKEKDFTKKDTINKEAVTKEIVKEPPVKEIKKEVSAKDANKKDIQGGQDSRKSNIPKEMPKKDIQVSKKDVNIPKKEISISRKDASVKEGLRDREGLTTDKESRIPSTKREIPRRDSKEDNPKKEIHKRSLTREERRESIKDDLRKRFHMKEASKAARKVDTDAKSPDVIKIEPVIKTEKTKRDVSEVTKDDGKEPKKERLNSESRQKHEEDRKEEQHSNKEFKTSVSNSRSRSLGEEEKTISTGERKEGKDPSRGADLKQDSGDSVDEKHEKRALFRSETPSTEDDKTNDAELPRTIGRKRMAAVSVVDSVPNSPASTTDEEKEYKSWKKSIMLLYGRLATHKYASLFLRPITDDQAPGYSSVVHRPIDLLTIKKNIETGIIRTTAEFQRDVMLMFLNSIMYNKSSHFVHKMAKQMQLEGMQHIQDHITTQMLVQVVGDGVPIRRETRTTEANKQRDMLVNPSGSASQDEGENTQMHKRKRNIGVDSERGFKKKKVDE